MSPSGLAGLTPRCADQAGRFRLVFEVPKTVWTAGEEIDGLATLQLVEGSASLISGPGYLAFAFSQVDGNRRVDPVWTDNCTPRRLALDAPIESRIIKTGAVVDEFNETFLGDPLVRLPAGVWEITAMADFYEGALCNGQRRKLSATVRLEVND